MSNGYDPSNQYPTDQTSYSNPAAANHPNALTGTDTSEIFSNLTVLLLFS